MRKTLAIMCMLLAGFAFGQGRTTPIKNAKFIGVADLNGETLTNVGSVVINNRAINAGVIDSLLGPSFEVITNAVATVTGFEKEYNVVSAFIPTNINGGVLKGTSFLNHDGVYGTVFTNAEASLIMWMQSITTNATMSRVVSTNVVKEYNIPPGGIIGMLVTNIVTTNVIEYTESFDWPVTGMLYRTQTITLPEEYFKHMPERLPAFNSLDLQYIDIQTQDVDSANWYVDAVWAFPENTPFADLMNNPVFADLYERNTSIVTLDNVWLDKTYDDRFVVGENVNKKCFYGDTTAAPTKIFYPLVVATNRTVVVTNTVLQDDEGTLWDTNSIVSRTVITTNDTKIGVNVFRYVVTPIADTNNILFVQSPESRDVFNHSSNSFFGFVISTKYIPVFNVTTNYLTNSVSQFSFPVYKDTWQDKALSFLDKLWGAVVCNAHAWPDAVIDPGGTSAANRALALAQACANAINSISGSAQALEIEIDGKIGELNNNYSAMKQTVYDEMSNLRDETQEALDTEQQEYDAWKQQIDQIYDASSADMKAALDKEEAARLSAIEAMNTQLSAMSGNVDTMSDSTTTQLDAIRSLITGLQGRIDSSEIALDEARAALLAEQNKELPDANVIAQLSATIEGLQRDIARGEVQLLSLAAQERILVNVEEITNVTNEDNSIIENNYLKLPFEWGTVIEYVNEKVGELRTVLDTAIESAMSSITGLAESIKLLSSAITEFAEKAVEAIEKALSKAEEAVSTADSAQRTAQQALDAINSIVAVVYDYGLDTYNMGITADDTVTCGASCDCRTGTGAQEGGENPEPPRPYPIDDVIRSCIEGCHGL